MNITITSHQSLYIGIMSGTSVDAIDVALLDISSAYNFKLLACIEVPFSQALRQRILKTCQSDSVSLEALGQLQNELSQAYAEAVIQLLRENQYQARDIAAIGVHGQTICHKPELPLPFSMQLVDPAIITANTNIACVNNFRAKDIALGGQGAPLVPLFHQHCLAPDNRVPEQPLVFLNLGGIANITQIVPAPIKGFDTGPANVLLDSWVAEHMGCNYDKDGEFARGGAINNGLLKHFLSDPYFSKAAPKSTGREYFNLCWIERYLASYYLKNLPPQDVMATLVALTATSIAQALPASPGQILVFGGGAKNKILMAELQRLLPNWLINTTEVVGLKPDFLEAAAFAWLAFTCVNGMPGNLPSVTGARSAAISGTITR